MQRQQDRAVDVLCGQEPLQPTALQRRLRDGHQQVVRRLLDHPPYPGADLRRSVDHAGDRAASDAGTRGNLLQGRPTGSAPGATGRNPQRHL